MADWDEVRNRSIIWKHFAEISAIPRGSYHEKEISDFIASFGRSRGLETRQDSIYNVGIVIPAAKDWEKEPAVILQGHMDMVCEKTPDSSHDFTKDPLQLYTDGDFLRAKDTTLGADDGIAVAYMLSVADLCTRKPADLKDCTEAEQRLAAGHPRIELVFTVSEETGMEGAEGYDTSFLQARQMLNVDSENEGHFLCGCAGGNRTVVTLPVEWETVPGVSAGYEMAGTLLHVKVTGLKGGHSGQDIHRGRANADRLLGRLLLQCRKSAREIGLVSIGGGTKDNAIPFTAEVELVVEDEAAFRQDAADLLQVLRAEYGVSDPDIDFQIQREEMRDLRIMTGETLRKIIYLLNVLPDGVQKLSMDAPGLVETSLNLGILRLDEEADTLTLVYLVRSSIDGSKAYISDRIRMAAEAVGAEVKIESTYPAWEYQKESGLREKVVRNYEKLTGKKPVTEIIHAGVECGLFGKKIPGLDAVSFGPDIYECHTFRERISISSAERVWQFILAVLTDRDEKAPEKKKK